MNKFVFTFGISWWIFAIFVLIALLLTYFYYRRTNPDLDFRSKFLLGVIRFFALFFLFFFLSEPVANFISNTFERPKIIALIDNSISMRLKWKNVDKLSQTRFSIENSRLLDFTKYPVEFMLFDGNYRFLGKFHLDSVKFNGEETNLSAPLRKISDLKYPENIQAVVVFTDGIVNAGDNPVYVAEKFGIPIYTIGIGDTIQPRDIVVTAITTNEIGFVDKPQPVKVSIKSVGYDNQILNVQLFDGSKLIGEQKINVSKSVEDYTAIFEFTPKEEGFAKLVAKVQPLQDEFTTENNAQTQIVKIIKSRKKYIIVSGYPNPDVAYLKSLILQEVGSEVVTFIQKFGSEFYEPKPTRKDFEEAQIIILLGYPISSSSIQILDWTKQEWEKGKSVLFISQSETDYNKLRQYEEMLPFNVVSNTPREYTFLANFEENQSGNPLLNILPGEDNIKLLNQLPPLFRTELFVRPKPESEILATVVINNVKMREPFILLNTFQNRKSASILGYGLYRWRLLGYSLKELIGDDAKKIDIGSEFLAKLFQWLTVSDELAKVRIKPAKNKFFLNEKVVFNAQIYDEALNPVDNAKVVVKITNGNEKFETLLPQVSSGLYSGDVGFLKEGEYSYTGEAYLKERLLGKMSGKFIVEKSNLEYIELRSNFEFLRYISKNTGAKFFLWNEMDKFQNELKNLHLNERVITKKKELNLWNSLPLLFVSIVLFSIEWYVRRKKGLL
jgi:hypothetical protein